MNNAEALRKKVIKTNGEMTRLMTEYEVSGKVVVRAPSRADMETWLAKDRPRRRAALPPSPGYDFTQSTASSNLSQISGEAALSDDYTGSDASSPVEETMEERSVNTETGMPDSQITDDTFSPEEQQRRKRAKRMKKLRKEEKKEKEENEDEDVSDGSGNSRQY